MITPDFTGFPECIREDVEKLVRSRNALTCISSDTINNLTSKSGMTEKQLLIKLLQIVKTMAVPSLSNFYVGCLVQGGSGKFYAGVNMEFPGETLSFTVHAEQCAIMNAWHHDEEIIDNLYVNYIPCGVCRQVFAELQSASHMRIHVNENEYSLVDLLPRPFTPADLGIKKFLMSRQSHELTINGKNGRLADSALEAARKSYAPYTSGYSGVALEIENGDIICGRYAENSAFNPSINPMTTALMNLNLTGYGFKMIKRAAIVQANKDSCSQVNAAKNLLNAVNRQAEIESYIADTTR